jgi:hypothetical protein
VIARASLANTAKPYHKVVLSCEPPNQFLLSNPAGAAALLVRIAQTIASSRPGLNPHTLTVRLRLRGLVRLMLARDSGKALQSARPPEPSRRWNNSNTSP